jgi:hypothetical protein
MKRDPAMRRNLVALVLVLFVGGCASFEGSSQSGSDSSAGLFDSLVSPFESASASSGSGGDEVAKASYILDVEAYTLAYLGAPGDDGEFARGLGEVAAAHGINDWEADADTFAAIGVAADDPRVESAARARLQRELAGFGPRD